MTIGSSRVTSSENGLLVDGELRNFAVMTGDAQTPQTFLIAHLPKPASASDPEPGVVIRLLAGQIGQVRSMSVFSFANGFSGLLSNRMQSGGQQAGAKHAEILAFTASDGGVDLYLTVGPGHVAANLSVEMPSGPVTIYANPEAKAPVGQQVFSSSSAASDQQH